MFAKKWKAVLQLVLFLFLAFPSCCLGAKTFSLSRNPSFSGNLYVYGDSHGTPFWELSFATQPPCKASTMHRVGVDKLDLSTIPLKRGDAVIFSFGMIDVGWHISKQRDREHRDVDEIIHTLVFNYLEAIRSITEPYDIIKIIYSVFPPSDELTDPKVPPYTCSVQDRAIFTVKLNALLQEFCPRYGLEYLDSYTNCKNAEGILKSDWRDPGSRFHLDPKYYHIPVSKFYEICKKYTF